MVHIKSLKVTASHLIGNKDRKKIKKIFENHTIFNDDCVYKINKTREKITFISENGIPILFSVDENIYIPTLNYVKDKEFLVKNKVFLDEGALKPLMNGANIMAPGIYKYKDRVSSSFGKGDPVFGIIKDEIVGVGFALMNFQDVLNNDKGVAVELYHRLGDGLTEIRV